ncbi:MAG: BtpA/SgcQ family protein [Cyanobacteria bacterium MAG CAR3_bin_5]|nr:BtpA/SgcQ family protein [Cyanobacteria bacterium MAG CAR3_bin_5]MCY4331274.1 BtpA/SgcQ family protein [Cyanobacteria bacterium MAG CAR1_bin_15]
MNRWRQLFGNRRPLIGVIHLPPLPGAPGWGGDMDGVETWALADAQAYASGGATAVLVENFGDHPFFPRQAPPETVAAMGRIATAVVRAVSLPVGINVLRNDGAAALAVAVASGARFIRVNVLSGAMVTDQGLIQGCAAQLLRQRRLLAADHVAVLADVLVKHALPLAPLPAPMAVQDTLKRGGADGVIVSGDSTGTPVEPEILQQARHAAQGAPVLIGSGFGPATADHLGPLCDGVIVASALKRDGQLCNPVDPQRVAQLRGRFHP